MIHKLIILLLFSLAFQSCVLAQGGKNETKPESNKEKKQEKKLYSASQFIHESFLFVKQPLLWKGCDYLKMGITTALTVSAMALDQPIISSIQRHQQYYYSVPVVAGRVYGEWYSIGGVAGIVGLYGWMTHDTAVKKISIELLQAGVYSEFVTSMLKIIIGRARPLTGESAFSYRPFTGLDFNYESMPSGHTTSAFALSTVMSRHVHSVPLKILAFVPAGFTMFSRLYQNKHWLSDEIVAAAIGYFVGNWVVDLHEGKRHRINVTAIYPYTTITVSLNKIPAK